MELPLDQQIFELIKKSNKILLILSESFSADAFASALALRSFLSKLQKDVNLVSFGKLSENLRFLPGSEHLQNQIAQDKTFVITVNTSQKQLEELSYQTSTQKAYIYLKSKGQQFSEEDLNFSNEKFKADLIISLGVASLEDLGKLHEENANLIFETPKINIDNEADNEYFGQLNLVDITAASIAEILYTLMLKFEEQLLDEDIATSLLAGIIVNTKSFQHVKTTPKAFLKASELIALGGRQQEIVKNIFKTKSLSLLKLWGRALARIKTVEDHLLVYSILNAADFEKSSATQEELFPALKELVENTSGYKAVALLSQPNADELKIFTAMHEQLSPDEFVKRIGGKSKILAEKQSNYQFIETDLTGMSLEELESRFLESVKKL